METASESVHQLLAFVDGVSRQGHPLSAVDFESYERSPSRTVHRFTRVTIGMLAGGPAESQLEWLDRVGWLQKNAGTVMITDLGRAVLRSLDEAANVPEGPLDVILDANEPTSYATVVGKIAGVGEALLVDPYCRLEQLLDIASHTSVDRVLTSAAIGKDGLVEMKLALPVLAEVAGSALDVRVSEKGELHDRYVIPLSGDVITMGTSLNSVDKHFTVLVTLGPPAAEAIRARFEADFAAASKLLGDPDPAAVPGGDLSS